MTHSATLRPQAVRTLARQPAPPGIYASKYTAELAAMICQRVAAGESLRSICRADPSAPWLETEARSMRELRRIVRAAHRRCAQIAPKAFADGVCGPEDR
ncbi:hypothetical protein [Phenylobacterium sp.]|uniref:terminase small subunit-like protein n=1 Tax=Phenylobacterium sp. TaxID=1871053 RepID=UPI003D2C448C